MSLKQKLKNIIEIIFKAKDINKTISQFQGITQIAKEPNKFMDIIKRKETEIGTGIRK